MVVINCTQKLLRRLKAPPCNEAPDAANMLGAWCANVFNIGRYPVVLLTNEKTFLSTVILFREFKDPSMVLISSLWRQLPELEISGDAVRSEIDHYAHVCWAAETKRNVLGTMNDLVFQIKTYVAMDEEFNIEKLERFLRKSPYSAIGYDSPEIAVRKLFGIVPSTKTPW